MAAEEAAVWPNSRRLPGIDCLCRERVQFTDLYCHPDADKQPHDANIAKIVLYFRHQVWCLCARPSGKESRRRFRKQKDDLRNLLNLSHQDHLSCKVVHLHSPPHKTLLYLQVINNIVHLKSLLCCFRYSHA